MNKLCDWNIEFEAKIKNEFLSIGKELIRNEFIILDDNKESITGLLKYCTGNEGIYNLDKGIYLYGNFGVGKTILFKIFQKILAKLFPFSKNGFHITSLEQIIEFYKRENNLDFYGYRRELKPIHLCINEFGKSINEKIYGTNADELIYSLFMVRYELFQTGYLTHITSNFKPESLKIEKILKDRTVEMFNFIEIKGESLRK